MEFYSKFKELSLPDNILLYWLKFDLSVQDDGPIGNPIIYKPSDLDQTHSDHIYFNGGNISFSKEIIPESYSVFFDFEKVSEKDSQIIFSNIDSFGDGYEFGSASSGIFFITLKQSDKEFTKFFKEILPSPRSMLLFKKHLGGFQLSYYDLAKDSFISQTVNFGNIFGGEGLQIGLKTEGAEDSNFKLFDLAVIYESIHGFLEEALCKAMNTNDCSYIRPAPPSIDINNLTLI